MYLYSVVFLCICVVYNKSLKINSINNDLFTINQKLFHIWNWLAHEIDLYILICEYGRSISITFFSSCYFFPQVLTHQHLPPYSSHFSSSSVLSFGVITRDVVDNMLDCNIVRTTVALLRSPLGEAWTPYLLGYRLSITSTVFFFFLERWLRL